MGPLGGRDGAGCRRHCVVGDGADLDFSADPFGSFGTGTLESLDHGVTGPKFSFTGRLDTTAARTWSSFR